jgi:hypothetical protein
LRNKINYIGQLKISAFIFLLWIVNVNQSNAQFADLGSWNIMNVKYNHDQKWSLFAEAQLRSLKFYDDFHYYEYKGGLQYALNQNTRLTLGAGSYQTYREGGDFVLPKNNDEFRIWPQVTLLQSSGLLKIEQRYRAELRFTSNGFRNRFRYRLGLSYPMGKSKNNTRPFHWIANNEIFFTDNEPYFERNRFFCGFNYSIASNTILQFGYLHQFDYKINDETGRDFLVLGMYYEIFQKKNEALRVEPESKNSN